MNKSWKPVTHSQLMHLLTQQFRLLEESGQSIWDTISLPSPELWQQHPWGDEGCGFWVIAVAGRSCIYFNDISNGFTCGTFQRWGKIDYYQPSEATLADALCALSANEDAQETA